MYFETETGILVLMTRGKKSESSLAICFWKTIMQLLMLYVQLASCVEIGLPMLLLVVFCQVISTLFYWHPSMTPSKFSKLRKLKLFSVSFLQHLQLIHPAAQVVLEKFALLICIGLIWAFAAVLTVAGTYNNAKPNTQQTCRVDRSYLLQSAPWYSSQIGIILLSLSLFWSSYDILSDIFPI